MDGKTGSEAGGGDVRESESDRARAAMRARRWAIARCHDPATYGIPPLPEWEVHRTADGLAFATEPGTEPFIRASNPVDVRR